MAKHLEALKPIDEFRAPWETEGGTDAEIDKPKLKRWIHGILSDKAKAQDARDDVQAKLTETEAALETAKAEAATANGPEAQKKIDALQKKVDELTAAATAREEADAKEALRKEVIGDLDPKYAKYVVGETREDLEKSLEDVKADFGIKDDGEEELDEDGEPVVRTTPQRRTRVVNPIDDQNGKGGDEIDYDKVADSILSGGNVFH